VARPAWAKLAGRSAWAKLAGRSAWAKWAGRPAWAKWAGRPALAKGYGAKPIFWRMVWSAMLTPWFAVSAGIVIAASLALVRPHPALTFPPSRSGRCVHARCASPSPATTGPAPAIKQEIRLPPQGARAKVEYKLLRSKHEHFVAVILIVSRRPLNNWRLRFVLPGATIDDIWGATAWQPEGQGGVIVTGSRSPWQKSGDNEARIIVFGTASTSSTSGAGGATGTGRLGWPKGCEFGNQRCAFRPLPRDAGHYLGGYASWHDRSAYSVFGN
jgi:hypothetical protein